MEHGGEGRARLVEWADSFAGEANSLVSLEHWCEFAAVAAGDKAVALADRRRNVGNLEAGGFSRMNGTAQCIEGFHEKRANEVWLEAAGLCFFHLLLHGEEALGVHDFLRESIAIKNVAKLVAIKGIFDALAKTGAHFGLISVADGLKKQVLEAVTLEDFAKDVEDAAIEGGALNAEFFKKPKKDITFAGFFGDKVPKVADLLLADTMDASESLFEAIRVPRQVVVHHQVGVLKVDAFTSGIGGDENADIWIGTKYRLNAAAFITVGSAVDGDDAAR